jgi:cell division protein FtsB
MVATLVSTLIGTFTTSMNLHDKIQDKRAQAKQKETDEGQDKKIQDLKQEVERLQLQDQRTCLPCQPLH